MTHVVAGLGTTGTLMGVGRFFADKKPDVKIIAAEPRYGELVYGLRNLDEGFVPELYDASLCERPILGRLPGLRSAGSASCWIARVSSPAFPPVPSCTPRLAQAVTAMQAGETADIVLIIADGGWKYLSTGAYTADLDTSEEFLDTQVWA